MTTGLSTLLSTKPSKVMFLTSPEPTFLPAHALMRAPFSAFDMRMFLQVGTHAHSFSKSGEGDEREGGLRSEDVLDEVVLAGVLAEGADRDTAVMRTGSVLLVLSTICVPSDLLGAIAGEVGHQYVGSVCPTNTPPLEPHCALHLDERHVLGLKLTQSSPLLMSESAMVTLSLRKMSHPSVFFAACEDVDTAEIVMLRKTMFFPSLTCRIKWSAQTSRRNQ